MKTEKQNEITSDKDREYVLVVVMPLEMLLVLLLALH
jgi:hypothetical protein